MIAKSIFISIPLLHFDKDTGLPVGHDALQSVPSYGVYLLTGILRSSGRECDIFDWVAQPTVSIKELADKCSNYQLILLSSNSFSWNIASNLASQIKKTNNKCNICIGGVHASIYPREVFATGFFDGVFVGEAEARICDIYDLVTNTGTSGNIPGLLTKSIDKLSFQNQIINRDEMRDNYKRVAYDLIPPDIFRSIPAETSRGCVHKCAFCATPSQRDWRALDATNCKHAIQYVKKYAFKSKFNRIQIIDDSFLTNHQRVIKLCENLDKNQFNKNIMYDARIKDMSNMNLLEILEPFTDSLLVGAEVCNEKDAKYIRKPVTPKSIESAARNLAKVGMADRAEFSFIVGFPWQNLKDCEVLLEYACNLSIKFGVRIYLQWYTPTPGSTMWYDLCNKGILTPDLVDTPSFFFDKSLFCSYRTVNIEEISIIEARIIIADLLFQARDKFETRRKLFYVGRAPV